MEDQEVEIEIERRRKPGWVVNLTDFANMVKAFIGSNYLYVAYAFKQSGLGLGIIGFIVIASLTDYCCHLIVKVKHKTIDRLALERNSQGKTKKKYYTVNNQNSRNGTPGDSGMDDSDSADEKDTAPLMGDEEDNDSDDIFGDNDSDDDLREHMFKHMTYGDIGKLSFGKWGFELVNFCIALTQFGFCVAYSIFIGNTIHSLFPQELCYTPNTTQICYPFSVTNSHVKRSANNSDYIGITSPSIAVNNIGGFSLVNSSKDVNTTLTTLTASLATAESNISTISPNLTTLSPNTTTKTTATTVPITTSTLEPNTTTISPNTTTMNTTAANYIRIVTSKAPDLKWLVAAPLPIFICFALIRSVRYLGFISMLANASILVGLVALTGFLISGFVHDGVHENVHLFNWQNFPVFFGMVTGAFEGIGLVIPIESSMEGNRQLFPCFLHGAVLILALILGGFGIMGYLLYGEGVKQMLNANIPAGNPLSIAVNIGICVGILLTFPLQIFPVIEILEKKLFSEGTLCGPKKDDSSSERTQLTDEDTEPLMDDVAVHIPASVPTWKRNFLRIFVVCLAGGLAILLRDNFAYVGAFVGAVGSSVLAYILPCLFHLKLCWYDLSRFVKIKDILIIIFGLVASLISAVTVIQEMVQNTKV